MLYPEILQAIERLTSNFSTIPEERRALLKSTATTISAELKSTGTVDLNFICTMNSRRSHLSQLWSQAAANYYNIENVNCYSGGTEATAFYPSAIRALKQIGFQIEEVEKSDNPVYSISISQETANIKAFSKKYNDPFNPQQDYIAIMTCNNANEACPVVIGAKAKIAITYTDPKLADGTDQEEKNYSQRSKQIGTEMLFLFSLVNA